MAVLITILKHNKYFYHPLHLFGMSVSVTYQTGSVITVISDAFSMCGIRRLDSSLGLPCNPILNPKISISN